MKLDNIIPILVMLVYVALVFLKRRKLKANAAKGNVPKKTAAAKAGKKSAPGPRIFVPKLFSEFGGSLKNFFSGIEQRFRMEVDKARIKNLEPAQFHGMGGGRTRLYDPYEKEVDPMPDVRPRKISCAKKEEPVQRMKKRMGKRCCLKGVDIDPSRKNIRNAVVWSEILAPPLALRNEKRPWEN